MMRRRGGDSGGQHGAGGTVPLFQAVRGSWMMRTMLSFATFAFVALLFFSHGLHLSETHAHQQALRIGTSGVDPVTNPIAPGLMKKSEMDGGLADALKEEPPRQLEQEQPKPKEDVKPPPPPPPKQDPPPPPPKEEEPAPPPPKKEEPAPPPPKEEPAPPPPKKEEPAPPPPKKEEPAPPPKEEQPPPPPPKEEPKQAPEPPKEKPQEPPQQKPEERPQPHHAPLPPPPPEAPPRAQPKTHFESKHHKVNSVKDVTKVWVDEEENPFDQDWETFPDEEVADHCGVSDLFYWDRYDDHDTYDNPWAKVGPKDKYVTFEPDHGGWNNIRMSMEVVLVFAFVTGRTLVLPPEQPMYLLNKGSPKHNMLDFADFFYLHRIKERMPTIEMEEFLEKEAMSGNMGQLPPGNTSKGQEHNALYKYLENAGHTMYWNPFKVCAVFPDKPDMALEEHSEEKQAEVKRFCGNRLPVFYDRELQDKKVIHFGTRDEARVLAHFYTFEHFMDTGLDHYVKRFVREFIHYRDEVFCAAGRIIAAMESAAGPEGYTAFHVRRGDLQFHEVKIPAEEIVETTKEVAPPGTVVYLATDETDEKYLGILRAQWKVFTLSDFADRIGLKKLNPNYVGMVEQIVCARGSVFVGTWFSTFSGYIQRMRGYYGFDYRTNYFHYKPRLNSFSTEYYPRESWYVREWPTGWVDIDD